MIMTKGKMIKELKAAGVRRAPGCGKPLEHLKTYEIINLYHDEIKSKREVSTEPTSEN